MGLKKVLVANRGEIAVRILRTLREMGIASVAVHSDADADAPHVRQADFAYNIGPAPAAHSYLNAERILEVAQISEADAVHPGYGFLSENAEFASACVAKGLSFIGPSATTIELMGSKTNARARMQQAGVPIMPGGSATSIDDAKRSAQALGYPVLIKASAGGGGKGMRLVNDEAQLISAYERARSEAERAFGDGTVYLEKALLNPRHVEIQVLGDQRGHVVHLFERDCSIQRRHQKVIEETPCPSLPASLVEQMGQISVQAAQAIGYFSAGTFEFLVDEKDQFYFLEMNTRLQVEHPITEWITGIDLVREMINVARGESLRFDQTEIVRRGAAIECRIYAEDPRKNFLPSPGLIEQLTVPTGPGVRDDSGIVQGFRVTPYYDPLLSKLSVWAADRPAAIARMKRALSEYSISGLCTNLSFHRHVMDNAEFQQGRYGTGFIERNAKTLLAGDQLSPEEERQLATAVAVAYAQQQEQAGKAASATADGAPSQWSIADRQRTD
ncbi:MAG TPA: acetyl-CoA carboxylase biotin carboxylase subunit [Polyangiaceae bacterium]|nr:acetyl-CoA carboxylase biotin carboxylase subunit [Polyangiaceae bacterium]